MRSLIRQVSVARRRALNASKPTYKRWLGSSGAAAFVISSSMWRSTRMTAGLTCSSAWSKLIAGDYSSRWTVAGENAGRQTAMYSAPSGPGVL